MEIFYIYPRLCRFAILSIAGYGVQYFLICYTESNVDGYKEEFLTSYEIPLNAFFHSCKALVKVMF